MQFSFDNDKMGLSLVTYLNYLKNKDKIAYILKGGGFPPPLHITSDVEFALAKESFRRNKDSIEFKLN